MISFSITTERKAFQLLFRRGFGFIKLETDTKGTFWQVNLYPKFQAYKQSFFDPKNGVTYKTLFGA